MSALGTMRLYGVVEHFDDDTRTGFALRANGRRYDLWTDAGGACVEWTLTTQDEDQTVLWTGTDVVALAGFLTELRADEEDGR